ncbi:hypothetical protein DL765_000421 [Monosporascus sp. GIB2]|nr:hypothetical protein DL765_000421 [Monosporascus sp. GIB2]
MDVDSDPDYPPPSLSLPEEDGLSPPLSLPGSDPCVMCGNDPTWVCVQCGGGVFCTVCWDKQWAHGKARVGPGGAKSGPRIPHEKVNQNVYYRLDEIFNNNNVQSDRYGLHEWEAGAKWFGICRANGGDFHLRDTRRFRDLTADSWTEECPEQFPSLVSFIGQTGNDTPPLVSFPVLLRLTDTRKGAGKSTIVRMLIALHQPPTGHSNVKDLHPIPGRKDGREPTTGDVQLYPDQATRGTRVPLFFADCEGLDGGDQEPIALRQKRSENVFRKRNELKKIMWANRPSRPKREQVVVDLFPKLLYTFSDVVVFVLKEARYLLPWAERSIDKSINQAALPHAIIVLNAMDIDVAEEENWDPSNTTKTHLEGLNSGFKCDQDLMKMADNLHRTGARVTTINELLNHYYASVTVIRMPTSLYYNRMDQQAVRLYAAIKEKCEESHQRKSRARMAPNAERMGHLVSSAFDHFSQNFDLPFDFLSEALRQNPISGTFEGNILQFILTFRRTSKQKDIRHDSAKLFNGLVPIISSCILLDIERNDLLGQYEELLHRRYKTHLRLAFDVFCESWLPCTYQRRGVQCYNFKSTHGQKGHQGADGKIFGVGSFQSDFNHSEFFEEWMQRIEEQLQYLDNQLSSQTQEYPTRKAAAANIHQGRMNELLSSGVHDVSDFASHQVCLFCLRHNMPEYPLPCGHVLCKACLETFSDGGGDWDTVRRLISCPFHSTRQGSTGQEFFRVHVKPPHAGLRILCLDGGGIRGIIQLAILRAIEKEFKGNLMIQWFFDLVVGTSTGGITALSLFVKNKPLDKCMDNFKVLCPIAFTPRELSGLPAFRRLATVYHGSEYKTRPFESVLKDLFGPHDLLFGGKKPQSECHAKVAITSTEATGKQQPVILTNYNRPQGKPGDALYGFVREEEPSKNVKIWEAARATSAAFPYFKMFVKHETGREFCDGGLYHNCPVKIASNERRLLWGDVEDMQPDIFLSLGTGRNSLANHASGSAGEGDFKRVKKRHFFHRAWGIAAGLLQTTRECQSVWDEFVRKSTESCRNDPEFESRYIRINVEVPGGVPKLHEADKVEGLERLIVNNRIPEAREVAHRLIASCFYFRLVSAEPDFKSLECRGYVIKGEIKCRFSDETPQIRGLGRFLKACIRGQFRPTFYLERKYRMSSKVLPDPHQSNVILIKETLIDDMHERGIFSLPVDGIVPPSTTIRLSIRLQEEAYSHGESYLSVSGSPRHLDAEKIMEEAREFWQSPRSGSGLRAKTLTPPPPYSVHSC